jgi:hypothetical protein
MRYDLELIYQWCREPGLSARVPLLTGLKEGRVLVCEMEEENRTVDRWLIHSEYYLASPPALPLMLIQYHAS